MFIVKFQIHWNKQFQTHLKAHLLAILVGKEATKLAANITSGTRATIEASFGESYYFFMSVCSFLFLHVCMYYLHYHIYQQTSPAALEQPLRRPSVNLITFFMSVCSFLFLHVCMYKSVKKAMFL